MTSQLARILLLPLLPICLAFAGNSELPDGSGKDLVENTCIDCHSLQRIQAQHLNEEGWNGIIREMIENGAAINPNDMKAIVSYLARNFGPDKPNKVNINKAPAKEIAETLDLVEAEAAAIVQYRTEHGKFKDLTELEKVGGFASKIQAKKALIEF